ncbi:MAG: hypothetical protein WC728_07775 [Elusimicrobiota bacterium]
MPDKDERKIEDLVELASHEQPEIPRFDGKGRKRRDRRNKGGAVLVGGGGSAGGAGSVAGSLGAGVAEPGIGSIAIRALGSKSAASGLITRMLQDFSLHHGLALLTIALTAAAVYSLYSMTGSGEKAPVLRAAQFPAAKGTFRSSDREDPEPATPGSLSYLMAANQGFTLRDAPGVDVRVAPPGGGPDPVLPPVLQDAALPASAKRLPEAGAGQAKPVIAASKGWGESKGVANATTLAGGAGFGGGVAQQFGLSAQGQPKAFTSQKSPYKARRDMKSVYSRGAAGSALEQLFRANSQSRRALGRTSSEGRSFEAAQAFGSGPYGTAAPVRPSGLGQGEAMKNPAASDPGDGGPIAGMTSAGDDPAPSPGKGEDKSPWTADVIAAEALLTTASGIITTIGALAVYRNMPVIGPMLQGYMMMLYAAATAMAATATALGVEIMTKHWQREQGIILTVGGAITTAAGVISLLAPQAVSPWVSVLGGIAGIAAAVGGLLAGMMNKDKGGDEDKKK